MRNAETDSRDAVPVTVTAGKVRCHVGQLEIVGQAPRPDKPVVCHDMTILLDGVPVMCRSARLEVRDGEVVVCHLEIVPETPGCPLPDVVTANRQE